MRAGLMPLILAMIVSASACMTKVVTDKDTMQPQKIVALKEGVEPEKIRIPVNADVVLTAWLIDRKAPHTILILHDDGNLFGTGPVINALSDVPANLFLFDYRGYGFSSGTPSEEGIYQDVVAAFDYLVSERKIRAESIIVYGRRLGASAALELATRRKIAGVVLEAVFSSAHQLYEDMDALFPFYLSIRSRPEEIFDNLAKAKNCAVPMVVICSQEVNAFSEHATQVLQASPSSNKRLITIQGTIGDKPDDFVQLFRRFLSEVDE